MFRHFKTDKIPSKETLIAIGIALGLDTGGIQELLCRAGYALSKSIYADAVVMWFLDSYKKGDVKRNILLMEINEALFNLELPLLMTRPAD